MLIKDAQLADVEKSQDRIVFNFIKDGELYEVIFRLQAYNTLSKKFEPSEEKEEQVEGWCKEYFDLSMNDIEKAVGTNKDVWVYDTFCSLWEVDSKFTPDQEGKVLSAKIKDIQMLNDCIYVRFVVDDDGLTYPKRYSFAKEVNGQRYPSPQKKAKRLEEFEKIFKVPFEDKDKLIGKKIQVEVKKAFGQFLYAEIKNL